ncbi:MAG: 4a-hydroxytetrahydrobiopterin dehydratase, partial [Steroidobacteraceae bacterium]
MASARSSRRRPGSGATGLGARRCVPCEGKVPPLPRADCERMLRELAPGWRLAADAKSLRREFKFRDFFRTMSFVNSIA